MENWVFGCDICQEVCPFNSQPVQTKEKAFQPSEGVGPFLSLKALFSIKTEADFKKQLHRTPLLRPKRKGLLRNGAVVLQNQHEAGGAHSFAQEALEQESDPLVKAHLHWAKDPIEKTINPVFQQGKKK
jgi:epoxyqueuosine reductase